jgi:hypothetical protein
MSGKKPKINKSIYFSPAKALRAGDNSAFNNKQRKKQ